MNDSESCGLVHMSKQNVVSGALAPSKRLHRSPVKQMTWCQLSLKLGVQILGNLHLRIEPSLW